MRVRIGLLLGVLLLLLASCGAKPAEAVAEKSPRPADPPQGVSPPAATPVVAELISASEEPEIPEELQIPEDLDYWDYPLEEEMPPILLDGELLGVREFDYAEKATMSFRVGDWQFYCTLTPEDEEFYFLAWPLGSDEEPCRISFSAATDFLHPCAVEENGRVYWVSVDLLAELYSATEAAAEREAGDESCILPELCSTVHSPKKAD